MLPEPINVLYRIKRGLAGYVSYLAACEMNASFSEYLLYEPILRILTARGFTVECEVACPRIDQPRTGDKKRLDFVAKKDGMTLAIEVKWAKKTRLSVKADQKKLKACKLFDTGWRAFLIVFGKRSCLSKINLRTTRFKEQGTMQVADLGITKFGCRVYELAEEQPAPRKHPWT